MSQSEVEVSVVKKFLIKIGILVGLQNVKGNDGFAVVYGVPGETHQIFQTSDQNALFFLAVLKIQQIIQRVGNPTD